MSIFAVFSTKKGYHSDFINYCLYIRLCRESNAYFSGFPSYIEKVALEAMQEGFQCGVKLTNILFEFSVYRV